MASRSRGPIEAAVALGATEAGTVADVAADERGRHPLRSQLPRGGGGGRRPAARPRPRARSSSTARPSTPTWSGPSTRGWPPPGPGTSTAPLSGGTVGRREGDAHGDGGGRRGHPRTRSGPPSTPWPDWSSTSGGPGMGQVVKLCNNLIYAAQMVATAEATALAAALGGGHGQAPRGPPPLDRGLRGGADPAAGRPVSSPTARPRTAGSPGS